MKINRIETVLLTVNLPQEVHWSGGVLSRAHAALIQVHTDEGISGLGEPYMGLFAPEAVRGIVESIELLLLGEDPTQVSALFQKMYTKTLFWARTGAGMSVIGAIESALWDILGKVRGLPVYELLGGKVHERLPLYASGGLEKPIDQTIEEMARYRTQGFKGVKARIGMGERQDVEKVERVREILGTQTALMVDAVQGHNPEPWSASQAIKVGLALQHLNVHWFEEPCAATNYTGYAHVRQHLSIPIAGGESATSLHEFRRFFEASALDIAQPDTAHAGGILECRKIAALAQSYGVELALHSWASSTMLAPNYHLAFATPNCSILEYPTWGYPLIEELFAESLRIEDGFVYPPTMPGLGVELTEEVRRKYPFRRGLGILMKRNE